MKDEQKGCLGCMGLIVILLGWCAWDAYPKFTWFEKMQSAAKLNGYLVIPGTADAKMIDLVSPGTLMFGGYRSHAWLAEERYKGCDNGSPSQGPIGILVSSITEESRQRDEFWVLFSSDRKYSRMVSFVPDEHGHFPELRGLLDAGDTQFNNKTIGRQHHEAVLRFITP